MKQVKTIILLILTSVTWVAFGISLAMPNDHKIEVENGWVKAVPLKSRTSAAFMKLNNKTATDDALISASCSIARVVELHNVREKEGSKQMYPVHQVAIPAHGSTRLKMGSYHLMLINLIRHPKVGDTVEFRLTFRQAGTIKITLPVREAPQMLDMSHGKEQGHDEKDSQFSRNSRKR